jgi:hypothetical protein
MAAALLIVLVGLEQRRIQRQARLGVQTAAPCDCLPALISAITAEARLVGAAGDRAVAANGRDGPDHRAVTPALLAASEIALSWLAMATPRRTVARVG